MMDDSHSRGKKQRIRKKIKQLKNPQDASVDPVEPKETKSVSKQKDVPAKQRVETLLKKREEKMQRKEK